MDDVRRWSSGMTNALRKTVQKSYEMWSNTVIISRPNRRRRGLLLPLPSRPLHPHSSSLEMVDTISEVIEEVLGEILSSLHDVQKNLQFWRSCAEGTDARKLRFMVLERGPLQFFKTAGEILHGVVTHGFQVQNLAITASTQIFIYISSLQTLQRHLSSFLAKIYKEVHVLGDHGGGDLGRDLMSHMLVAIQSAFLDWENIDKVLESFQDNGTFQHTSQNSILLQFEMFPDELIQKNDWSDAEIQLVLGMISSNIRKLADFLSLIISRYRRPTRAARKWVRYTGTTIGLVVCSSWLLRHSRLMGSSDLDNWIMDARDSTAAFWKDHVEMPLVAIRDELFETFRKRHQGVAELEEVQLTASSLHRMLYAFCEQTTGKKLPVNASEQEMMEIMMGRYEKELTHPLQSLLGGELARALLIQIQKLKLDMETAMLELNQILRANEINFAILAALPAFFATVILAALLRIPFTKDKGAEGKGRAARLHRRLLIGELEEKLIGYQVLLDKKQDTDALCTFGMVIYTLNRLYKVTERHAKASGEWKRLRADIIMLANPQLATHYKLPITLRMGSHYECLLPSQRGLF